MAEIRLAAAADAEAIAHQRVRMFVDAGLAGEATLGPMAANFANWVRPKLEDGSYAGWLAEDNGRPVAGAGLWVMDFPPHFLDPGSRRAYLLNFYVAPQMRHRGLARNLLRLALAEALSRGIRIVTLHASKFGRPLYEQHGFKQTTEMMLRPGS